MSAINTWLAAHPAIAHAVTSLGTAVLTLLTTYLTKLGSQ